MLIVLLPPCAALVALVIESKPGTWLMVAATEEENKPPMAELATL
jgi:hypothetical protein